MGVTFPYATVEAEWGDEEFEGYELDVGMRRALCRENVLKLFPWFARKYGTRETSIAT